MLPHRHSSTRRISVRDRASRHIGLLVVAGVLFVCGRDAVTAADTTASAPGPSTTSLTPEQAGDLVSSANGTIALDAVTSLSPEAAIQLAANEGGLSLDGLSSLDAAVAQALAMHGRLDGVDPDSIDIDAVLAKLGGLFAVDGDGEMDVDGLLNGIESLLTDLPAEATGDDADGAAPDASDPWLSLGGLKTITPGVAAALAMHDGPLLLDGLTTITPDVAGALATHSGELSLAGLQSLGADARAALASHDGPVVLPDALVNASGGQ